MKVFKEPMLQTPLKSPRIHHEAWQLMQRLEQDTAALFFCQQDGRYYFVLRGMTVDLVRSSTFNVLNRASFLRLDRTLEPWYVINEKGRAALRQRANKEAADTGL